MPGVGMTGRRIESSAMKKKLANGDPLRPVSGKELGQVVQMMTDAGVLKVAGRKMEHGRLVPMHVAVARDAWPPEGHTLMAGSDEGSAA